MPAQRGSRHGGAGLQMLQNDGAISVPGEGSEEASDPGMSFAFLSCWQNMKKFNTTEQQQ